MKKIVSRVKLGRVRIYAGNWRSCSPDPERRCCPSTRKGLDEAQKAARRSVDEYSRAVQDLATLNSYDSYDS